MPKIIQSLLAPKTPGSARGMKWANEHGITRIHSAGQDFEALDLFDEMRRRGDLTLRMYIAYFLNPPELRPQDLEAIEHARKKFHDDWIDAGAR